MLSNIHPLTWIAVIPVLALVPATVAYRKGYTFLDAWSISILFLPMALVIVPFLPADKVCRYCLERIKAKASACRHCGRWQETSPDPLTRGPPFQRPPSQHPPFQGIQALDRPGEQRLQVWTGATEIALDDSGHDRRSRTDQVLRSAGQPRWPSSRLMAVGVGILAVVAVAVLVLPGTWGSYWGEAKHPFDAADATTLMPNGRGALASVALNEMEPGGMVGTPNDSDVEIDAAGEPSGPARREAPSIAAPAQATGRLGGWEQGTPWAASLPTRVSTLAKVTDDTIAPPSAMPPTNVVRELQAMLTELGYALGPVDGIMGEKTKAALRHYQSAKALSSGSPVDMPLLPTRTSPVESAKNQPGPVSLLPKNMSKEKP
ncbi:MAG TPA: peptidoglycan-binding domain-containing protein [Gammaproteobacteria bacterium]|nr:peptidoglycan-binding domain-containing protein [Gammaproteobacteria bacterium]